jgi:alkylation response protein AidB-like acyl-CoA dehydrogenase
MASFYDDNDDLRWYMDKGLDWSELVHLTEYEGRAPDAPASTADAVASYRAVLGLFGEFAAETVAPLAKHVDTQKMHVAGGEVVIPEALSTIFEAFQGMEVYGMCLPRELGGLNVPVLLYNMSIEVVGRADVSVVAHYGFHGGIAMALLLYSVLEGTTEFDREAGRITHTRFAEAIDEIRRGVAWGSMDITEPDAGSDMGALRARAEQGPDGTWYVTGQKIYITSGHGKYHIVIARTEPAGDPADPFAGLGGLSLFLVPAYEDTPEGRKRTTTTIDKVEDKLGHNGSATVAISYERTPSFLIGKRGEGFKMMLLLMNNARVGVGFESLGLCEAAWRSAAAYAATRPSMGKTIDKHEMIADMIDEMRTDAQAIRALAVNAGLHEELAQKLNLKLKFFPPEDRAELERVERAQKRHTQIARRLTPLVKYLGSEKAVEMARRAIQIHGGSGYIKEYDAEKLLRDAVVFPIYEGTSQIQALMSMKDTLLGAIRRPQDFLRGAATARWRSVSARNPLDRRVARLQTLSYAAQQHLLTRIAGGKFRDLRSVPVAGWGSALQDWDPKRDFGPAMLHAERLIRLLTDVAVAEVLLDQAERFPERVELLERFLERAEPRCRNLHDVITTTGDRLLAALGAEDVTNAAAK